MIRLKVVIGLVGLSFSLLFLRLIKIQLIDHEKYLQRAESNYIKALRIPHIRGRIFDRNGKVLASWVPAFRLSVMAEHITPEDLDSLANFLGIRIDKKKLKQGPGYIPLVDNIPFEKAILLEEESERFPWVVVSTFPMRSYTRDSVLARAISHIVGYVGEASQEDIKKRGYSIGDYVGKYGIERQYEEYLRGKDGYRFFAVDVMGRIVKTDPRPRIDPQKGHDLELTIDSELEKVIDSLFREYDRGACVVIDVKTGEVLASYSKPGFDPNKISYGLTPSEWNELVNTPDKPLLNRVICGIYPPGSIFKLASASIALDVGAVDSTTRFRPCHGSFRFGRRVWGCWKPSGHGSLDLPHAIEHSCDVYFYQLGIAVGLNRFLDEAHKLGMDKPVGVDLPGECRGFIPTIEWYRKTYGPRGFGPGNVLNLAIGQGELLFTPIEIATFTGLIARGKMPRPHFVREILGVGPPRVDTLYFPLDTTKLGAVRYGMWLVVNDPGGTAYWHRPKVVEAAGKTGTAQNPHGKDHALFTAYAPYKDPEIVVTVVVENSGHGGSVAAPIASAVIDWYFSHRQAALSQTTY